MSRVNTPLEARQVQEPRAEASSAAAVVHGSPDYEELRRLGIDPLAVLDFSANVNPYGPAPAVRAAVAAAALERYPDREALDLRMTLGEALGVAPARLLAGNGTSELIWLVALAFLRRGARVLVLGPTYGEYARAAAMVGARVTTWRADQEKDFTVAPAEVLDCLARVLPSLVFVCNPNNPTGTVLPPALLADWARRHPAALFVVDEAYLAFAPGLGSVLETAGDNVVVLRSMTKDYALAGLRLGYAIGSEEAIAALARVQPPWSVSALAQAAGCAALRAREHLAQSLARLVGAKQELEHGLNELGLRPLPSAVHYFLVRVGNGAHLRQALLKRAILIRDAASFGLPAYVRIATRRPEENARLLTALREVRP